MAINFGTVSSGKGVDHGSGATLDDLHAADMVVWAWVNRRAAGSNLHIFTKDNTFPSGWALFSSANGNLAWSSRNATTHASYISEDGVLVQDVDTFVCALYNGTAKSTRLFVGTKAKAPVEVVYATQTPGSGAISTDATAKLYVGNLERSTTLPFYGDIQMGGVMAATGTPALVLDLWRSSYNTNKARTGTKLAFDYTDNTTLTDGSGNGNNGTLLASASTGTTISLSPPTSKAVTEANIHFSPYNWYSDGGGAMGANNIKGSSTYAQSPNPGAYLKTKVTVGTLGAINLEIDPTSYAALASTATPMVTYRVGRSASGTKVVSVNDPAVQIASGLAAGTYEVEIMFRSLDLNTTGDRFATPERALKVLALLIDSDGSLAAPTVFTKNLLVFGDSLSEGVNILGTGLLTSVIDAEQCWPLPLGRFLRAEVGVVAYGGAGFARGIGNGAASTTQPALYNSDSTKRFYDFYAGGKSRLVSSLYSPAPDYIAIQMGVNDSSLTAANVTDAIDAIRTAAGSSAYIIVGGGPSATDAVWSTVATGVAAAAQTSRTSLATTTRTITAGSAGNYTSDGGGGSQHANSRGAAREAGDWGADFNSALGGFGGGGVTSRVGNSFVRSA